MKTLSLLAAALFALAGSNAHANAELARSVMLTELNMSIAGEMHTNNVINWKVGEFQELDLSAMFGSLGSMKKYVASEEGNALWMNQETSGMIGAHKIEALLDRATGKVLRMKQDGQEQKVPDSKMEIIDQEATNITVPAGTFEVIHITAKADGKKVEVWMNPRDITMDGTAQMVAETQLFPITMKLTKFGGK